MYSPHTALRRLGSVLRSALLLLMPVALAAPAFAAPPPRGSGPPAARGPAGTPKSACVDLAVQRPDAKILAHGRYTTRHPANGDNVWVHVQTTVRNLSRTDFRGPAQVELQLATPQHGWVTVGRGHVSRIPAGRAARTGISYFWHGAAGYTTDIGAVRLVVTHDQECNLRDNESPVHGVPFKQFAEKAAELASR